MARRWRLPKPLAPAFPWPIITAPSVTNTAHPLRITSSRELKRRETATLVSSAWAAIASHSEKPMMANNHEKRMKMNTQESPSKPGLTIRFHLTDGSIHSFTQGDEAINEKLWDGIEPSRLFAHQ